MVTARVRRAQNPRFQLRELGLVTVAWDAILWDGLPNRYHLIPIRQVQWERLRWMTIDEIVQGQRRKQLHPDVVAYRQWVAAVQVPEGL